MEILAFYSGQKTAFQTKLVWLMCQMGIVMLPKINNKIYNTKINLQEMSMGEVVNGNDANNANNANNNLLTKTK